MGTITDVAEQTLLVETALGSLKLSVNRWTRIHHLDDSCNSGQPLIPATSQAIRERCIGQLCMGRFITYLGDTCKQTENLNCTDLCLQGHQDGAVPFSAPDFWVRQLTRVADWWRRHAIDTDRGGYFTDVSQDGLARHGPGKTDKWSYVVSRTLYAFSTAFALTGERRFLNAARIGVRFLSEKATFEQAGHTLFNTRLNCHGQRHSDDPELVNIFTQIYSLTGLIAYYEISRCPQARMLIESNLKAVSDLFHDCEYGGYFDAIGRSNLQPTPGITDSKSFNSIVDPLSATLFFLQNAKFRSAHLDAREAIRELCALILKYMVDPKHNFIREIFNRSWQCQRPKWRNPYNTDFDAGNVGGNLKVIWVLLRAMDDLPPHLKSAAGTEVHRIYDNLVSSGAWDALRGGWFEVMHRESPAGSRADHMGHTNKVWWQQEEGIMASLLLHLAYRHKGHQKMAYDCLRLWLTYFVDRSNGGVFDTVSIDGWPLNGLPLNRQKGSWLKGGYHETELARFVHIYLSVLHNRPVTLYYVYEYPKDRTQYESVPARIPGLTWYVIKEELVAEDLIKVEYGYRW